MENKTVLVVEDNKLNMKLIVALLTIGNYRILKAEDAEIGIQMIKKHRPDLILMDIQLPGMDGLSATRTIKKDEDLKDIPVVALTSYAMAGDKEKVMEAGCDGYIPKPIETRTFLAKLSQFLDNEGPE